MYLGGVKHSWNSAGSVLRHAHHASQEQKCHTRPHCRALLAVCTMEHGISGGSAARGRAPASADVSATPQQRPAHIPRQSRGARQPAHPQNQPCDARCARARYAVHKRFCILPQRHTAYACQMLLPVCTARCVLSIYVCVCVCLVCACVCVSGSLSSDPFNRIAGEAGKAAEQSWRSTVANSLAARRAAAHTQSEYPLGGTEAASPSATAQTATVVSVLRSVHGCYEY